MSIDNYMFVCMSQTMYLHFLTELLLNALLQRHNQGLHIPPCIVIVAINK